jgi:hypothetical protein
MNDKLDQNNKGQQKWLRLLLETLVRAAIQGIPFVGSSLHQLTFGYHDSTEFDKIKSSVDSLQENINLVLSEKKDLTLNDAPAIANEIISSERFQETLFESKIPLINEDTQFIGELITYIELKFIGKDEKLFRKIESLKSTIKDKQASHTQELERIYSAQESQIQKIDMLLKRVETTSKSQNNHKRQDIIEILNNLNSTDLTLLESVSKIIINADNWLTNFLPSELLSIDTHEIIQYGYAPYQLNTGQLNLSLSVLFSEKYKKPFALFPATGKELQSFLNANRRYLSDPNRFLDKFKKAQNINDIDPLLQHIIANIVSPIESPFKRIHRLLRSGCIIQYKEPYQTEGKYKDYLEDAFEFLCTVRRMPSKRFANYVDASNLAQIAMLNINSPNSSKAVTSLNSLQKTSMRLKEKFNLQYDLVVTPVTLVASRYLENLKVIERSKMRSSAESTNEIKKFIENIMNTIKASNKSKMVGLGEEIISFRNDIELFVKSINPFHRHILFDSLKDWKIPETKLNTKQEQQFEASYAEILSDLSALLEWFEPFEEAMQPFNEVADKLSKNEDTLAQPGTSADA